MLDLGQNHKSYYLVASVDNEFKCVVYDPFHILDVLAHTLGENLKAFHQLLEISFDIAKVFPDFLQSRCFTDPCPCLARLGIPSGLFSQGVITLMGAKEFLETNIE